MLIDYTKINGLDNHLGIILLDFLKGEKIKVSPEYMEQLISFHKLNMLKSEYIADDLLDLINKK